MKQNLFFVLIAIALLYIVYSFSKNNKLLSYNQTTNLNKTNHKEHFQVDYSLIGKVGSDILSDPIDITESTQYWERLNANLEDHNSNLSASNQTIRGELDKIGGMIRDISKSNGQLSESIERLIGENSELENYIRAQTNCQIDTTGTTQPYGISNCDGIFDPEVMEIYRNRLDTRVKELEATVNGLLVQDSYDELDLDADGVTGLTAEKIREIIIHVQNVKRMYQSFFNSLTYSVEDRDTTGWAARTSQIMATAESNCLNKEDTCIYANRDDNNNVLDYYTSNMNHVFHSDLWPSEQSCKADPESNCSFRGELASSNCDDRTKTCFDLISDGDVNSGHSNNNDKLGHISYNSASYRYTSEQLSNDNGDLIGKWNCELNYPSPDTRVDSPNCKTQSNVIDMARSNCEWVSELWGVSSYDCYTNTGTNEVNGFATYSGAEELPSVSYSQRSSDRSKVWSNTSNDDGSFGTCTVDDTCRTVAETSNMATCLSQTNSNDYTNNYLCYGTSGTNTGISNVSKSNYRNKYQVGSFDSNDNQWTNGTCSNAYSNYTDCRTKADVDAEVAWKTTNNWQCHTYSNGEVNALQKWNKIYKENTGFPTLSNQGIGKSTTSEFCRKQADAEAQSNCLNTNQYDCWDQQDSNGQILMHFSKSSSDVNKIYNLPTSTQDDTYAGMSNFDSNCTSNDDCTSRDDALSNVRGHCEATNVRSTCYKEGTASSNPFGDEVSWSIVYDSNQLFGQYSTRVQTGSNNIKCVERAEGECSSKSNVCESKSNKCYTPLPTYSPDSNTNFFDMSSPSNFTYKSSMLDSTSSNCIADNSECTTLPYCSYMAVETNNSNEFVWGDIGNNDCSEPSEGKRYRWTLETNSVEAVSNPALYTSNSDHWRQVNTDATSNSFCTPVNSMVRNDVETITNEADGSNILCQCQSNNNDHYGLRYYDGSFDSNTPSNTGYSTLSNLQSSNCESNECRARNYYTANERLVECTHPEELASNTQGELGVGEKYLDITLSENGLLCYNDNACSNLCLVSGPSNNLQIGDGIYNDEAQSNPAQCYTYGSSNQQNRFSYDSYAADGSLLTTMPTCTDLVDSNCSSNQNDNCGQQYNLMNDIPENNWGTAEYIPGTTNSNTTYTDTYDGTVRRFNGTDVTISNNVVTYDSSCPGLVASDTDVTKRGLFKYVYEDAYDGDGKCIPETTTYVKYQVQNIDPSVTDFGSHSNCPMDCVTARPTDITAAYEQTDSHFEGDACPSDISEGSAVPTRTMKHQVTHAESYGGTCTIPTYDYTCRHVNRPCNSNSWTGSYNCPSCGAASTYTQTRTAPTGNNTGLGTGECRSEHLTTSQTVSTGCTTTQSKPCCTASYYGDWRYQSGSESTWNSPPCETTYRRSKTLDTNRCTNTNRLLETVTDTNTNSLSCDVHCVLSTWTQSGTCPTHCGYGGSNKVYTASITTQKQGNGSNCEAVAEASKPDASTTANSYSIDGNIVTATYTRGCPSTSLCTLPIPPSNVIASNITHNSATITWSNNDNGSIADNDITIKLQYKKTDNSQWQNVPTTNSSSSHTLTNLDSSTSYQVQIIKIVDTSSYSGRTFSGGALSTSYESRITNFDTPDLPECQRKMLPNTSYEYKWYKKKANEPDSSYVSIDDMLFANSYGSWSWMGEQYMYAKRAFSRDVNSTSEQHYVLCTEDPDGTTVKMEPVYVNTSNCRINPGTIRDLWTCGQRSYYTGQPGFGTANRQRNVDNNWCAYHNVFH